jgi:Integrase core domain
VRSPELRGAGYRLGPTFPRRVRSRIFSSLVLGEDALDVE